MNKRQEKRTWKVLKSQRYKGITWCEHEINEKFCLACKAERERKSQVKQMRAASRLKKLAA